MRNEASIAVIIPALDEEHSLGKVIGEIPSWVDDIVVSDNGSRDRTVEVALEQGARTVAAERRGYGSACLKAMAALDSPDIVVFLDGDYSDYPAQMDRLVDPILAGEADLVIGSRPRGQHAKGALTPQARFGNQLACFFIRLFWGVRFTDLGPFRAIRYSTLMNLGMRDPDYGWTVEMQIKAILQKVPCHEVPVDYRKRIGKSKVSGTVRGVAGAGYKILSTIFVSAARHELARRGPSRRLIVFTRYPQPGKTKTRLIPALGEEGAADLQRQMTERMLGESGRLSDTSVEIHYAGESARRMREWLGDRWLLRPQADGDLGKRMCTAFQQAFASRVDFVAVVGVDSPELTAGVLEAAYSGLRRNDAVLGPATDGGYYLVGLNRRAARRALPGFFEGIPWGTGEVYDKTVAFVQRERLRLCRLATLDDVDRPEDLKVWERAQEDETEGGRAPTLSVIIPSLNEAEHAPETIARIQAEEGDTEILVVDGGSQDGTIEKVRALGVTVLSVSGGRAAQMNFGAAKARGKRLLFLHADTRLPPGFTTQVVEVLDRPGVVAGAFRFETDDPSRTMRFIGWWANLRSKWLQMPYGDQGLFIMKQTFRETGGFANLPIMEDFELVRRLVRRGRVSLARDAAVASSRRWRTMGRWRTMARNQLVVLAYYLHISPARIARFYNRTRGLSI